MDNNSTQPPSVLSKGSLVFFHYNLWKNDPNPMVILSYYKPGIMIKGVNLHYLTFESIRRVLQIGSGNPNFAYDNIKGGQYIDLVNAFRSYSWRGIDFGSIKIMDGKFLVQMMQQVRSFDPSQIQAIRERIESQLNQTFQPQASPSGPMPLTGNTPSALPVPPAAPV